VGSDGEGVEVVGEDRPRGPDLHPVIALEPGAAHAVAAFEMADAALDPGAVARSAFAGAARAWLVAAGELDLVVGQVGERMFGRAGEEAAVGHDLARADPGAVQFGGGLGQRLVLGRVPGRVAGGEDEPARSLAGVLGHLADLRDVPELGRFAELAFADRPGVRVGDRHQPVGDLDPADAAVDLLGHPPAARRQLFQPPGSRELGAGSATAC
jgi:hypothetical protein